MKRSRLVLERFRTERRLMVQQYVGHHWSEEGTSEKVPVNLISLYISVVGRNLIAKNPRVMLATFDRGLKPTVSAMQAWANKEIEHMRLQETLQRVVVDALFSIGICKVALATPADAASMAWNLGAGEPFAERVDLDDFVYDIHARDFSEVAYIGHRFRVPLQSVKDSNLYHKSRKDLTASDDPLYNQESDERISVLGRGTYGGIEEFEDMVDLWEIFLPRHRLVVTLADDQLSGAATAPGQEKEPLRVQPWLGTETGPYHILSMGIVPGNAMPKGPIQDLIDLHEAANKAYRKVVRMSERTKELTAVQGGAMEDGSRVMQADDGDLLRLDNPDKIKQFVMGGQALQGVIAWATTAKDLFAYCAGNLDMMGGLSPQSKTAAQDKLLAENSTRALADMQDRTISFTSQAIKALCWYWWHDPFKVQKSKHALPGLPNLQMQRQVTPAQRQQGRFEDLDITVDPYSMQHNTPQSRMAALNQVVTTIVMPMMQLLVQQGISFDINAYLQKIAAYMDMPDLAEIITIQDVPTPDVSTGASKERKMPLQTERTYNRTNTPSQTRESSDRNLVATMFGHNLGGNPNGQPQQNGSVQ